MEEAGAAVQVVAPYAHWDIPAIGQVGDGAHLPWALVAKLDEA